MTRRPLPHADVIAAHHRLLDVERPKGTGFRIIALGVCALALMGIVVAVGSI